MGVGGGEGMDGVLSRVLVFVDQPLVFSSVVSKNGGNNVERSGRNIRC